LAKQSTPLRRGGNKPSSAIIRRQLAYRAGRNINLEDYEGGIIKFQALVRGYLQRKKYLKHHSGQVG
jgi:IQ calmodulin-binding motif